MYQLILLVHVFAALFIIALVLIQQGKGASVGAAFGSGASQTLFGSRGAGSFMFRLTMGLAILFFVTSLGLNYMATHAYKKEKASAFAYVPVKKMTVPVRETAPVQVPTENPKG
jgi:preprotein translocase subunit SecG